MGNISKNDSLGDKLKAVEQVEAGRALAAEKPLMVRLDGRGFSKFTRGLKKPFDVRLAELMTETTKHLVDKFQAVLGYTQSDEITLYWLPADPKNGHLFGGRIQKITSVLAGAASAFFNKNLAAALPEKASELPVFDCRAWSVDEIRDVYLNFLWREQDARKNAITLAALQVYEHEQLQGVNSLEKLDLLAKAGVDFNAYPIFFTRGNYVARVVKKIELTEEELARIPEKNRPTGPIDRTFVEVLKCPNMDKHAAPTEFVRAPSHVNP